jgi:RNA polymerase sigma factor (sigma-70 family)
VCRKERNEKWGRNMHTKNSGQNDYYYRFPDHKILTSAEEKQLFKNYNKAPEDSKLKRALRDEIILSNMKFTASTALTLKSRYYSIKPKDLIAYGMIGLFAAIDKFDYTLGRRFITLAVFDIRQQVHKNVQDLEGTVRYPAHKHIEHHKSMKDGDYNETIMDALNTLHGGMSLEGQINPSSNVKLIDVLKDESTESELKNTVRDMKLKDAVKYMKFYLDEKSMKVLSAHFGLNGYAVQTTKEISESMNVTPEAIRAIEKKSFKVLRNTYALKNLHSLINTPIEKSLY